MKVIQPCAERQDHHYPWYPLQFCLARSFHFKKNAAPEGGSPHSWLFCPALPLPGVTQPGNPLAMWQRGRELVTWLCECAPSFQLAFHAVPKLIYQIWPVVPGSLSYFCTPLSKHLLGKRWLGSCFLAIPSQPRLGWMDGNVVGGRVGIISPCQIPKCSRY